MLATIDLLHILFRIVTFDDFVRFATGTPNPWWQSSGVWTLISAVVGAAIGGICSYAGTQALQRRNSLDRLTSIKNSIKLWSEVEVKRSIKVEESFSSQKETLQDLIDLLQEILIYFSPKRNEVPLDKITKYRLHDTNLNDDQVLQEFVDTLGSFISYPITAPSWSSALLNEQVSIDFEVLSIAFEIETIATQLHRLDQKLVDLYSESSTILFRATMVSPSMKELAVWDLKHEGELFLALQQQYAYLTAYLGTYQRLQHYLRKQVLPALETTSGTPSR